jgi:hypothetical protein
MRVRGPLVGLLAIALLAWAALHTTRPDAAAPAAALQAQPAAAPVRQIGDLDRAAERLRTRPAVQRAVEPSRNPFEFVDARPPASARQMEPAAAVAALAPIVAPVPPAVTLVGLVDRQVDGRMVRTAVLSFGGRLHYVEAGERLDGAYEVVAVGPNAVDLLALDTRTPRRLVQR